MKLKTFLATTAASTLIAGAASAQVADSFDDLIDNVLGDNVDAAFFSGAVNTSEIDASVNIDGGSIVPAGTLDDDFTFIGQDAFSNTDDSAFNDGFVSTTGSLSVTVNELTQDFGQIDTVAAGAISQGDIDITGEEGIVNASAQASDASRAVSSSVDTQTGGTTGLVTGALNDANVNASVTMDVANVNTLADGISTTAVGALNDTDVTASFTGSGADVDTSAILGE